MGKHLNGESASFRASFIEREQKKLNVAFSPGKMKKCLIYASLHVKVILSAHLF